MIEPGDITSTPLGEPIGEQEIEGRIGQDPSLDFLYDWFELSPTDRLVEANQEQVNYIFDYIKTITGKEDRMAIFNFLRDTSYRLGAPKIGASKLQHIYQYVKIQNQRRLLDIQEEELHG